MSVSCSYCGKTTEEEDIRTIEDGAYCPSCQEDFAECDHCNDTLHTDSLTRCHGRWYCEECANEVLAECHFCNGSMLKSRMDFIECVDDYVCRDCQDEYLTVCVCCDSTIEISNSHSSVSGSVCETCMDENYRTCENCRDLVQMDDLSYSDDDECWYCNNCQDMHQTGKMHGYSYKPEPIFHGHPGEIHFGIEVEVNANSSNIDSICQHAGKNKEKEFYGKEDASIGDGVEIVTHPMTLDYHQKFWPKLMPKMPTPPNVSGWRSGKCGIHVHIQRGKLTVMDINKMIVFVNHSDNQRFMHAMAQRKDNHYCMYDSNKKLTSRLTGDRYEVVNTSNRSTIEIRMFRSSWRMGRILKAVEFCHAMVMFVKQTSYMDLTPDKFMLWLSQQPSKIYRNLIEFLIEIEVWKHKIPTKPLPPAIDTGHKHKSKSKEKQPKCA